MHRVIVVAAVLLIAGCGSGRPRTNTNGRVDGSALAGPTCPVEQPGDPNCQPKPVQGTVRFAQGGHVVSSAGIDAGGGFATEIPAGTYTVTIDTGASSFPVCPPVEVEVRAGSDAVVEISCDTGIR